MAIGISHVEQESIFPVSRSGACILLDFRRYRWVRGTAASLLCSSLLYPPTANLPNKNVVIDGLTHGGRPKNDLLPTPAVPACQILPS